MNRFDVPLASESYSRTDLVKLQVFERILKDNVEAIVITDTQGNIEWVNHAFSVLTGYVDILEKNAALLFADAQGSYEVMRQKLVDMQHHTIEAQMCRMDGGEFSANVTLSAVRSDADMVTHHVLEFSDITEFRRAQDELERRTKELSRSNQELEQFAYVASHDLQEPLRMVASYTQLIAQRYRDKLDADADEFIEFAVDGATRMQAIINDLLMLSRVGTRNLAFTRVDSKSSLDRALANLRLVIGETGAEIICDTLPVVDADGSQLTQLFQNLIGNALKFHGDRSPLVRIGAEKQDGEWVFYVSDNGIGIAPEHFERIFLMFQRLHGKREYPGTGIGLTICKKIVERHGGKIWVESAQGKGTTFYFTVPTQQKSK
ncbi:MAG: PAS domain-containing sensor histidine kinase [Gallionellaceae bacterium]|nr:MAG: PAS domain-containing sensor histidine kinase [Gallionellaceae bacterium]